MKNKHVSACWLTINRACNLSCSWCYAKNSNQLSSMPFKDACSVLDLLANIGIRTVILLGGEPTCYKELPRLLQECKERSLHSVIITNGIRLADKKYLDELISSGLKTISISQKAPNAEGYIKTTGVDCYGALLRAIDNVSERGISPVISYVLTSESICTISESIAVAKAHGAKRFSLGFCYDFEACRGEQGKPENPYLLWNLFEENYDAINAAADGNFVLQMGLPLCVANKKVIQTMNERGQIKTVCQALRQSGLIIDTDLSVIPCNAMYNFKLGKVNVDFSDKTTFEDFWSSDRVVSFYNRIKSVPDMACTYCDSWSNCGGGCLSNWFNYKFSDLKKLKEETL